MCISTLAVDNTLFDKGIWFQSLEKYSGLIKASEVYKYDLRLTFFDLYRTVNEVALFRVPTHP